MYKFNTNNALTVYGIEFLPGTYNELMKLPKRKAGLVQEWANENGTERYLAQPYYETIVYNLPILMMAKNETEFWSRYNAFTTFLITSGLFNFDVADMKRRFRLSYSDMTRVDKLTQIKGSTNIGCGFTLQLFNDYPTERIVIS